MIKNNEPIHEDGGLFEATLPISITHPLGQGYSKVNTSENKRYIIKLDMTDNTSQEAELFSALCGLIYAVKEGREEVYSDSQFVVNTVMKNWKSREPRLRLIVGAIKSLYKHFGITMKWIPREENYST